MNPDLTAGSHPPNGLVLRQTVCVVLCLMFFLSLSGCGSSETSGQSASVSATSRLVVKFFNVGKADAILLSSDEYNVLVDTGTADTASQLEEELTSLGISQIDYLVLTHFDQDHVGGAADILNDFTVSHVLTTYESKTSDEIDAYHEAMQEQGLSAERIEEVTTCMLGGVEITIYPPEETDYGDDTSNDSSLVIKVTFQDISFLLTGDIEKDRIEELLSSGADLSALVLKVPHHGEYEDELDSLVEAVSPDYAVITSSDDEREDSQTVDVLEQAQAAVYLTRQGTVTMVCDGTTLTVTQQSAE